MRAIIYISTLLCLFIISSCNEDWEIKHISEIQTCIQNNIPKQSVIAHRGTCIWAPENTEAAMRWARNSGADYLECDLQRTSDGYIVIYHDMILQSKSNVNTIFKNTNKTNIRDFTLEELLKLDFGAWFNRDHSEYARESFYNSDILTLEDLIMICEGYKIKRDKDNKRIFKKIDNRIVTEYEPDSTDNGNRPGIYIEIKYQDLHQGIEQDIKNELVRLGWYAHNISELKEIKTKAGCVNTANTPARVVIQTFSTHTLKELNKVFDPIIPICRLIAESENTNVDEKTYRKWINEAVKYNAVIIAPSINSDYPDNFLDLLQPWMYDLIKESGLLIHPFTFNNTTQMDYYKDMCDGYFCNDTYSAVKHLNNESNMDSYSGEIILNYLGY